MTDESVTEEVEVTPTTAESTTKESLTTEDHPVLLLLDEIEAKLFFVGTEIATDIKRVVDNIRSHI